ncbi:MAG: endonuclease/exonuclease/phosphatase family protein [Alphaproteobacteria bacterium]|nr:endonuclease/exonuclease/phosphatase family protein [Alphaproteobacteria bacterium]
MAVYTILLSNLGYARGIGGTLAEHIRYAHRHIYCPPDIQKETLRQLGHLVEAEDPDICCFVEIDQGSFSSARFNQLSALLNEKYSFFDIENKYAPGSRLRSFFITAGKSNAFISKREFPYDKIYFNQGTKRLIYRINLGNDVTLFFAHFSLNRAVRALQMIEVQKLMREAPGEVIFLGDFNVLRGLSEVEPLLDGGHFILMNKKDSPTFRFHNRHLVLDLCICSPGIAAQAALKVVPQVFSDHAALVLRVEI